MGYQDTTINIEIEEGKTIVQNVTLSFGTALGEVIVTAMAFGQVKAINTQLSAIAIKNVVSEVKIRELPDANAAEALARLPGVSVVREGGEAVDIKVRGVSNNTLYVNGIPMAGGLNTISPYLIGSIELNKAFLPDQDANVEGASVDLKMREAPSGFKKDITLRQGYNGFTKSLKMQDASLILSDRFLADKLGLMLSLSYDRKDRGRDALSAGYEPIISSRPGVGSNDVLPVKLNDVSLTHTQNLNNRYGVALFTDYKLKNGKLYYNGFFSALESQNWSAINDYTNAAAIFYNSTFNKNTGKNLLNGINGEHVLFGAKIDWGLYYSQTSSSMPNQLSYRSYNPSGMINLNSIDSTTTIPEYMALGTNNLSNTAAENLNKDWYSSYTNELGYKLNIEIPFGLGKKLMDL